MRPASCAQANAIGERAVELAHTDGRVWEDALTALRDAEAGASDDPRSETSRSSRSSKPPPRRRSRSRRSARTSRRSRRSPASTASATYRADAAAAAALAAGGASAAAHLVRVNLGVRSADPRLARALASEQAAHDVAARLLESPPVSRLRRALTDAELVRGCRAGDAEAWNELVERYSRYVYAIAVRGFRLSDEDAEDVFQDVFTRIYTRLDSLRDDSALRPWIAQLTRRRCLDAIARAARGARRGASTEEGSTDLSDVEEAFEVREALAGLSGSVPGHPRPLLHARPELQDDRRRARDPVRDDREPHRALPRPAPRDELEGRNEARRGV